jgi:hypothetical protein
MTRFEANREIMKRLSKAIKDNPDQRFGQLLRNLGVVREQGYDVDQCGTPPRWVNEFNTESEFTLNNMIAEEKKRES